MSQSITAQESSLKKDVGTIQKTMGKIDQMNNKKLAQLQALIQQSEKKLTDAKNKSEKGLKKDLEKINALVEDHSRRLTSLAKGKGGGGARGSSVMAATSSSVKKPESVVNSDQVSQKSQAKDVAGAVVEEAASKEALSVSKTPQPTEDKEKVNPTPA